MYRDGQIRYVSEERQDDVNFLCPVIYPSLKELNSKDEWDEVKAQYITRNKFETIWVSIFS